MSKSRGIKPDPKSEREEFFDALFGPDEEITLEAARDILDTYEISGEQLVDKLKARLQQRIKDIAGETGTLPKSLEATLKNIREYQKEKEPNAVNADEWIGEIFSGAMPNAHAQPLYDFRNSRAGQVSKKDRSILDQIRAELEE